jgi:hypothetical protein
MRRFAWSYKGKLKPCDACTHGAVWRLTPRGGMKRFACELHVRDILVGYVYSAGITAIHCPHGFGLRGGPQGPISQKGHSHPASTRLRTAGNLGEVT